jgi:hypothetical protein
MRIVRAALLFKLLFSIVFAGCGGGGPVSDGKGPETVPVNGKVVFQRGGDVKSLADKQGRIELQSVEKPGLIAVGAIAEDGTFTVATITPEGGSLGAVPGNHRVRLNLEENAQSLVAPQFLDFTRSGITIKLPSEQPIEVAVWR